MVQKMEMKNILKTGAVLLLNLLLLLVFMPGGQAESVVPEQPLAEYANSIMATLHADDEETPLPQYVENEQYLFIKLFIDEIDSEKLVNYLQENPVADFYIPVQFTNNILDGTFPKAFYTEDVDNLITDEQTQKPMCRWWIENSTIRIRFVDEWVSEAIDKDGVVANISATMAFDAILDGSKKDDNGLIEFQVGQDVFPLIMKAGYELTKEAGTVELDAEKGYYKVPFTVTFYVDQHMINATPATDDTSYKAVLNLVDTLTGNSAMSGTIVEGPFIETADGNTSLTISNSADGSVNTFTFPENAEIKKGTYTIKFTMTVKDEAAVKSLSGFNKTNTIILQENDEYPLTAKDDIIWDNDASNRRKIRKAFAPQQAGSVYHAYQGSDGNFYADYYVAVYTKDSFSTLTVEEKMGSNMKLASVTLEGVYSGSDFWEKTADTLPSGLSQSNASVNVSGNIITLSAADAQKLPAGVYYLKVKVNINGVLDSIKNLSASSNKEEYVSYTNKACITKVGETTVLEESETVKENLPKPKAFMKRGTVQVNDDLTWVTETINGVDYHLVRWDVFFEWNFPNVPPKITDTMPLPQTMHVMSSSGHDHGFKIYCMDHSSAEELVLLSAADSNEYISFNPDESGFVLDASKIPEIADHKEHQLKLLYTTKVPANAQTSVFDCANNWEIEYPSMLPPGEGSGSGPVGSGYDLPSRDPNMSLNLQKTALDKKGYEQHDGYLTWQLTIDNTSNAVENKTTPVAMEHITSLVLKDAIQVTAMKETWPPDAKLEDMKAWFDFSLSGYEPVVVMTPEKGKDISLTAGTHYSLMPDQEDAGKFSVVFDVQKLKEALGESTYFKKIQLTVRSINSDGNNQDYPSNKDPRLVIENTGILDYSIGGGEMPSVESRVEFERKFTSSYKRLLGWDEETKDEAYVDYDNDGIKEFRYQLEVGSGTFPTTVAKFKITDTLPPELKLKYTGEDWRKSFQAYYKDNTSIRISLDDAEFDWNEETNTFTLCFTKTAAGKYNVRLDYDTVLRDGVLQNAMEQNPNANQLVFDLTNKAIIEMDGLLLQEHNPSFDVTVNHVALSKEDQLIKSAGNKLQYTLQLNPEGVLLGQGTSIQLEDMMGSGSDFFEYLPSSFKLVNLKTGTQMARGSSVSATSYVLKLAEDRKSFTMDVPDGTPMKLSYQVKTNLPIGTDNVRLINEANLAGRSVSNTGTTFKVKASWQSGSFEVLSNQAGISLFKINEEDELEEQPKGLPGAVFAVQQLNADGTVKETLEDMSTDNNGMLGLIRELSFREDQIILLTEKKAPVGYSLGSTPWKGCFVLLKLGESATELDLDALKTALGCDVQVVENGGIAYVTVTNEPASLMIQKVNEEGEALSGAEFELAKNGTVILPAAIEETGEWKFKGLTAGEYTLRETKAPAGYDLPEEEKEWKFTLDASGKITLDAQYELLSVSEDGTGLVIVNLPPVIDITGEKDWEDAENLHNTRPESITIALLSDGAEADSVTVTADDNWTWNFTGLPKYDADGNPITYTVEEKPVPDGYESEITGNAEEGFNIKNTYVFPVAVEITAKKTLEGHSLADKQFTFVLLDINGSTVCEGSNDALGNVTFDSIEYSSAGVFTYTMQEVNDGRNGYTYDTKEYTVTVTVTQDDETRQLSADVAYSLNNEKVDAVVFENEYSATNSLQFSGTKFLTGAELEEGQFSFILADSEGNEMETVTHDEDGNFVFTAIEYDQDDIGKSFTYTIREVNDAKSGYTYDDTAYAITVTVEDNDGTLKITAVGAEDIVFKNVYTPAGTATITITGEKTVAGDVPEEDEVFTFQLKDEEGNVIQEVENKGSEIAFEAIDYTEADIGKTYKYTITESSQSNEHYRKDDSEYIVTVTLSDNGMGGVNAAWILEKNGETMDAIVFDNTPLSTLEIHKTVIGGDTEKLFAFKVTLMDAEGRTMEGSFPVEGADVTSIESGSYLCLKHGETAIISHLPVGTLFTVEEDEYTDYDTAAAGEKGRMVKGEIPADGNLADFVNTLKNADFSVTKKWQGGGDGLITLILYANGEMLDPQPAYTVSNNVYTYTGLPRYTEDGEVIVYSAKEEAVDGYVTTYCNIAPYTEETDMIYNGGTIVNQKLPETGDESRIGLWIAMSLISASFFILLMKKRKEA